jgi:hypothetical protein
MKTSTKWILGIVIGLLVGCILLAVVGGAGYWALNRSGMLGWEMGARTGRLWGNQATPFNGMPMHAYYGFFSPLRYIAFPLLCLGVITLIVLGIVALVRSSSKPRPAEAATVPAPAPAPVVAPAAEPVQAVAEAPVQAVQPATHPCPNCGREVQEDWVSCPYCGAPLK